MKAVPFLPPTVRQLCLILDIMNTDTGRVTACSSPSLLSTASTIARDVFDEGRCYTNRICPEGNNPETGGADLSWLTRGLGKDYLILQTMLRRWPGDEWSQGVLELVADIAKAHHISAESIESIIIDPATANRMYVPEEGYISAMQAQLSMPFMVASSTLILFPDLSGIRLTG